MDQPNTPPPSGMPAPTPTAAPAKKSSSKVWWFVSGAIIVLGALVVRLIHG